MWALLAVIVIAWLLWTVGSLLSLEVDKLQKKRPADAGVSLLPGIPFVPMALLGLAWLIDQFAAPWGIRLVGGLHLIMIVMGVVGILHEVRRIRLARRAMHETPNAG